MSDPFEILGLTPQASEEEIRARYLELVREYPPDRAPERFASVRSAYDELRDPLRRLDDEVLALCLPIFSGCSTVPKIVTKPELIVMEHCRG